MAKLTVREIRDLGRQIVLSHPGGIRYGEIARAILNEHPETSANTVYVQITELPGRFPAEISKPARGLYLPVASPGTGRQEVQPAPLSVPPAAVREEDFYTPFADWLRNELEEVTVAIALGGASFQKKWGTPDVVGVYRPKASDRIKFDPEIIAAEIKIDPQTPVVAFGQAAAYRLFAAKSYVVMPSSVSGDDYSRLEALCMLFGIGLVLFDVNTDEPDFRIRVRAQRFSPDMFYVNEFAERLYRIDPATFNELFA